MLEDPEIQAVLCRILAPFQGPELHTMTVLEIPLGGLGSSWVITSNGSLRDFAKGAALEIPDLRGPMPDDQQLTTPERL